MGIFSRIFKSKRDKILAKIKAGKATAKDGLYLADEYIKRATVLRQKASVLRGKSETGKKDLNNKFNPYNDVNFKPNEYPMYDSLTKYYNNHYNACEPIIAASDIILDGLKEQKKNLQESQKVLDKAEQNLMSLDVKNETKQLEYQIAIEEADAIIEDRTKKIEEYKNNIAAFEETIKKGEDAAAELETVEAKIKELMKEDKESARSGLSEDKELRRKEIKKELAEARTKRGELEETVDEGVAAEREKFKIGVNVKKAEKEIYKAETGKEKLLETERKRMVRYEESKGKLTGFKEEAEEKIQGSLSRLVQLKEELGIQELGYNAVKKGYNDTLHDEKSSKHLKNEERMANLKTVTDTKKSAQTEPLQLNPGRSSMEI